MMRCHDVRGAQRRSAAAKQGRHEERRSARHESQNHGGRNGFFATLMLIYQQGGMRRSLTHAGVLGYGARTERAHSMNSDKIVITSADVAGPKVPEAPRATHDPTIPLRWRLFSAVLVLCPPVLFLVVVLGMVAVRRSDLSRRYAHAFHYLCLLLASCILLMISALVLALHPVRQVRGPAAERSAISFDQFPSLPSGRPLTGREIAEQLSALVVVVHPDSSKPFRITGQASGAGVVVLAHGEGLLVLTSRHVIDAIRGKAKLGEYAGITLRDARETRAAVVGLHDTLDLALMWVKREGAHSEYVQPFRSFESVAIGEEVFVIGHPEGLDFSISSGLVAQVRGKDVIQLSAPVSPGNSGGPIFDSYGRLMAIVQGIVDKTKNPNAENLGFGVRVDDIQDVSAWTVADEGRDAIGILASKRAEESEVSP